MMHTRRLWFALRLALGGAVGGIFLGTFVGGLLGACYGGFAGNVSLGLDGALGGGCLGGLGGLCYGAALALQGERQQRSRTTARDGEDHSRDGGTSPRQAILAEEPK
jgi:hypothetical protein